MLIVINSRRVDAYKLKIYMNKKCIYDAYMFSNTKSNIDIATVSGDSLRFEYDFNLSKNELETLRQREDCPEWKTNAYDSSDLMHNNFDWIGENRCPNTAKGVYATVVSDINDDTECIHLMFRRSALNPDMPLLYIMNRKERETFTIRYEKVVNAAKMISDTKKILKKRLFFDLLIILSLLFIAILLFAFNCTLAIISPILFTVALLLYRIYNLAVGYCEFFRTINDMQAFREKKGKVISI